MARRLRQPDARYPDARYPAAADPASPAGAYGHEVPPGHDVPPGLLRPRNGAGRAALICGVLALICAIGFFLILTVPVAIILGLAAVILGFLGRGRVRRGIATNRGSATLGLVTGLLSLLLLAGLAIGGVALFNHNKQDFKTFGQCAQNAGNDSHKLQQCQQQFRNSITH